MLDSTLDRALYRQLADRLRTDINRGVYPPGSVIPSETSLIERYGVARNTVRLAVQILRYEGLVDTRQGYGTFVCEPWPSE